MEFKEVYLMLEVYLPIGLLILVVALYLFFMVFAPYLEWLRKLFNKVDAAINRLLGLAKK